MSFLDAILNLAALLLWLNWRSVGLVVTPLPGKSLAALLQPAEKPRGGPPKLLLFLILLLLVRAVFYWQIGEPVGWHPALGFGVVPLTFRSNILGLMLIYSLLSFARTLVIFYLWLLFVSFVNRDVNDSEPCQRWVRVHLGALERWPDWLKLVLPVFATGFLWVALTPLLEWLRIVPPLPSDGAWGFVVKQGMIIGFSVVLAWEFLIVGLLLLHLLNSYIHLGAHPFWNFITLTAHNLLRGLAWLPLRAGKVDFAPVVAIALMWALAWLTMSPRFGLLRLFQMLSA